MTTTTIKRGTTAALIATFCILAIAYVADPGRRKTKRRLVAESQLLTHDNMLSSLNVTAIAEDSCGMVWIGTSAGINVYDGQTYTQFAHDARDSTALPDDYINTLHRDRHGRMWVGTQNGVALYTGAGRFRRFALPEGDGNVTLIADGRGRDEVVAATAGRRHGCYAISPSGVRPATAAMLPHPAPPTAIPGAPFSLRKPQQIVSCTFRDSEGNVWVGFRNAGYQVVSERLTAFKRANANALAAATEGKDVVTLSRVGRSLLAGTTLRLYVYDQSRDRVAETYFSQLFDSVAATRRELLSAVALDGSRAWLVGNRQVLSCRVSGSTIAAEGRAFGATRGTAQLGAATRVGDTLYVSSDGALLSFGYATGAPRRTPVASRWYDSETQLATLADGRVLLFMRNMQLALFSPRDGRITPLATSGDTADGNTDPAFARQDSYGNVWLGTKRSGLYRLSLATGRMERTAFLSDVHIQGMSEDPGRNLWFTTLKDVTCYDPRTGTATPNPLLSSSLNNWTRQYFDNSVCLAPDGSSVVFGSSDGCRFISVEAARKAMATAMKPSRQPRIYSLAITTQDGRRLLLDDNTRGGSSYTFAHDENTLSVRYFYPDYGKSTAAMFQCRLDGYDHEWQPPTFRREATYANLPPGRYVLRLRMLTSHGHKAVGEQRVSITVRPAWWASSAAWLFYASCLVVLLFYLNTLYLRLRMGRLQLVQEQHEREREQRMREMNMSFFANISHEFRTPLTMISGPVEQLCESTDINKHNKQLLNIINRSVNRMLKLVNQLLDFNKLENDTLRLHVKLCDIVTEMQRIIDLFIVNAEEKGITLNCHGLEGSYLIWLDVDKLEKIINNLMSNAMKFTPRGGKIDVTLDSEIDKKGMQWVKITVADTGKGIPEKELDNIFKRYYQLNNQSASTINWGTGIGLYYARSLALLHHGKLFANNRKDCQGAVFTLALPTHEEIYSDAEKRNLEEEQKMELSAKKDSMIANKIEQEDGSDNRPKVLIVDDDTEVVHYLRTLLATDYHVIYRFDAESALKAIREEEPSLILSDVVMPGISGYELCKAIKQDIQLCHIPVILVTAKTTPENQVEGLNSGADAYVTKPFTPKVLLAMINSLLTNREKAKTILNNATQTDKSVEEVLSPQDKAFMDELYKIMEQELANSELDVNKATELMHISRTKLYYKVKGLTGENPSVFFKTYKLNRAAALIVEGKYNISEIAYMTGFNTLSHFSTSFKKQFGCTPSEYSKKTY